MRPRYFVLSVILCVLYGNGTVFCQPNRSAPTFRGTILKNWTATEAEDELPLYRVVEGEILEYNSQRGLILQLPSGMKETHHFASIAAIRSLDTEWQAATGTENKAKDAEDTDKNWTATVKPAQLQSLALQNRQTARTTAEKNEWTAKLIAIYTMIGDEKSAIIEFTSLVENDKFSPYFDIVPLTWQAKSLAKTPTDIELDRQAMSILAATETAAEPFVPAAPSPVMSLWAASVLLTHADTAVRSRAAKVLESLTFLEHNVGSATSPVIPLIPLTEDMRYVAAKTAKLAAVQQWRTKLATIRNDNELRFMENQLRGLPATQQAGPLMLLGDGYSRLGNSEKAVACWLKAAMTCPEQRTTAVYGLRQSIAALRLLNRPDQAATLQRLLDDRYPNIP